MAVPDNIFSIIFGHLQTLFTNQVTLPSLSLSLLAYSVLTTSLFTINLSFSSPLSLPPHSLLLTPHPPAREFSHHTLRPIRDLGVASVAFAEVLPQSPRECRQHSQSVGGSAERRRAQEVVGMRSLIFFLNYFFFLSLSPFLRFICESYGKLLFSQLTPFPLLLLHSSSLSLFPSHIPARKCRRSRTS